MFIGPLLPLEERFSRASASRDRCQWGWREVFKKEQPPLPQPPTRDPFPEERQHVPSRVVPLNISTVGHGVTGGWTLCGRHTFWVRSQLEAEDVEKAGAEWHLWNNEPAEAIHGDELPADLPDAGKFVPDMVGRYWPCPKVTCSRCHVNRDRMFEAALVTVKYRGPEVVLTFNREPRLDDWKTGIYRP